MQIITAKITTLRTLYAHVVSNSVVFPEILYDIVLHARHFLPVKCFSEYYYYKLLYNIQGRFQKNSSVTFISEEYTQKYIFIRQVIAYY